MSKKNHWGNNGWTLIHSVSLLLIQNKDDKIFNIRAKQFIKNFWMYIPCRRCRNDAMAYLNKNKVHDSKDIFKYTYEFHNHVNQKLKKQEITFEEYKDRYKSVNESIIDKINNYTEHLKKYGTRSGITRNNLVFYNEFIRYLHSSRKLFKLKWF